MAISGGRHGLRARLDLGPDHDGRGALRSCRRRGPERAGQLRAVAQRTPRPPRLRPWVEVSARLPDDDRQRRQRKRTVGRQPRRRGTRTGSRLAGPLVRSAVPAAVRRLDRARSSRRSDRLGCRWSPGAVRSSGRGVVVLPQPIRVVGVQPRTTLAATASARRPRLATTHLDVSRDRATSTGRHSVSVGNTPSAERGSAARSAPTSSSTRAGGPVEQRVDRVAMLVQRRLQSRQHRLAKGGDRLRRGPHVQQGSSQRRDPRLDIVARVGERVDRREPVAPQVGVPRVTVTPRRHHLFDRRFGELACPSAQRLEEQVLHGDPPPATPTQVVQRVPHCVPRPRRPFLAAPRLAPRRSHPRDAPAHDRQLSSATPSSVAGDPPRRYSRSIWRHGPDASSLPRMALTPHTTRSRIT